MDIAAYIVAGVGGLVLAFAGLHGFQNKSVTIVSFGVGAILVIIGGCLYWQDAIWKRDAAQNERPWVLANGVELKTPLEVGHVITAMAYFINTSKIPANDTRIQTWINVTNKTDVAALRRDPLTEWQSSGVASPSQPMVQEVSTKNLLLSEHLKWIQDKTFFIYVSGVVTYEIPGGRGKTEFCYVYEPKTTSFVNFREGNKAE
jgi:hypothetical protein